MNLTQLIFPHRPLIWDVDPLHRDTELFVLGVGIDGNVEPDQQQVAEKSIQAAVGGWRYDGDVFFLDDSFRYDSDAALIWRCDQRTISGLSGALLVKKGDILDGDLVEWKAVAFQSHEFSDTVVSRADILDSAGDIAWQRKMFWKVAYRPDGELVKEFWAYAPEHLLRNLEVIAARKRYPLLQHQLTDISMFPSLFLERQR